MQDYLFNASGSQVFRIAGEKGLGATGEGYVEEFTKSLWCGYRPEFSSKYTEKGTCQEDIGIKLVADVYGLGWLSKNTERKRNEWVNGECDLNLANCLRDIKCPWNAHTFPFFAQEIPTKGYEWQAQTYMFLWEKEQYFLDYCLVDAPDHVIDREYWSNHKKLEIKGDEVDEDLYNEVRKKMIHEHLPAEERVKTFEIKRNDLMIKKIIERVELGRIYQEKLLKLYPIKSLQNGN